MPSGLHRKSPQVLNISSIRVFDQISDLKIPVTLRPPFNYNTLIYLKIPSATAPKIPWSIETIAVIVRRWQCNWSRGSAILFHLTWAARGRVGEWAVTDVKWRKGWRMSSLTFPSLHLHHTSFSDGSVALPTSQLILQTFFRFFYVTGSSLTSPGEPLIITTVFRYFSYQTVSYATRLTHFRTYIPRKISRVGLWPGIEPGTLRVIVRHINHCNVGLGMVQYLL